MCNMPYVYFKYSFDAIWCYLTLCGAVQCGVVWCAVL